MIFLFFRGYTLIKKAVTMPQHDEPMPISPLFEKGERKMS